MTQVITLYLRIHIQDDDDEEVRMWEMEMIKKGGAALHSEVARKEIKRAMKKLQEQVTISPFMPCCDCLCILRP
jgi:predicted DNA-binding protein (UPF0251 family)